MKFTAAAAFLSLSGAAIAASYTTPTTTPCPTSKSMTGTTPPTGGYEAPTPAYEAPTTAPTPGYEAPTDDGYVAPPSPPKKRKGKKGKKPKTPKTGGVTPRGYTPTPAPETYEAPPKTSTKGPAGGYTPTPAPETYKAEEPTTPYTSTETPPTGSEYTPMDSMTGTTPPAPGMQPCDKPKGYTAGAPAPAPYTAPAAAPAPAPYTGPAAAPAPAPYTGAAAPAPAAKPVPAAAPASGSGPEMIPTGDPRPAVTPEPEGPGSSATSLEGAESSASGNTTASVAVDEKSGVASGNAEEDGAVIGAVTPGAGIALSTSGRQGVMYTDENGVQYFQDATGQWYYYPSPTPAPTMAPTPVPDGSSIMIDDLEAESTGDNTVTVGATEDKAAGSANGLNGALAAALVSPGAPGAIGLAF